MHIHILGICGTFMGGIAAIAKQLGHKVTGSDLNVYPPMSTQLESLGIELTQGWSREQFKVEPDLVIIGNALSRGNEAVEFVLARNIPYTSGPEWLKREVLQNRWVVAVSGTHGKTSTASMVAWLLESCDMSPGYLIGGVPGNFEVSARLGESPFFVIEADEYDTAFFDKRSKFVHYLPKTLIFNNLEFDHADIFSDLAAIQTQFHHLIRTLPGNGLLLCDTAVPAIQETLDKGLWSPIETINVDPKPLSKIPKPETNDEISHVSPDAQSSWHAKLQPNSLGQIDGSTFDVFLNDKNVGTVNWQLSGHHNVHNALMALAAARHCGMAVEICIDALSEFINAKRRMELRSNANDIAIYDDFAHHPTAIKTTLAGLRAKVGKQRIIAIIEPRSNTMKSDVHADTLGHSWQDADMVFVYQPSDNWGCAVPENSVETEFVNSVDKIVQRTVDLATKGDHIVVMSNGGFQGIHEKLILALQ